MSSDVIPQARSRPNPPSLPPEQIVSGAGLPAPLAELVLAVTGKTRLWRRERAEVARELVSHFSEGLAVGKTAELLAEIFGDPAKAARLITRAKKRSRPLAWHAARRSLKCAAALVLAMVLAYSFLFARYYLASPRITVNYLAEFNKAALAVPEAQRAWPTYRRAYMNLMQNLDDHTFDELSSKQFDVSPGDELWPLLVQYTEQYKAASELVRQAAAMERSGYIVCPDDYVTKETPADPWGTTVPPPQVNTPVMSIFLPQLGGYRMFAKLLISELRVAAARGDGQTVAANLSAITGLARHASEDGIIISQLVGIALIEMVNAELASVLAAQPELLSPQQLRDVAHALGAYTIRSGFASEGVDFSVERSMITDMLQRAFTDNGAGDGYFIGVSESFWQNFGHRSPSANDKALIPLASAAMASRKETLRAYDEFAEAMATVNAQLPYLRDTAAVRDRFQALPQAGMGMKYAFMFSMLPAFSFAQVKADTALQRRDAMLTAIAIELYRREHGNPPAALADLVPQLLPKLPLDRFSGQPLRYLPQGNELSGGKPLLYSVGVNRIDDHGSVAVPPSPAPPATQPATVAATGQFSATPTLDWVLWPIATPGSEPQYYLWHEPAWPLPKPAFTNLFPWINLRGV